MPYTERSKPQVVLNKMTKAVYDSIEKDPDQLYAVTDADILPVASADTLGGIKVGENLTIGEDGTLNAQAGSAEVIEMFDLDSATAQEIADAITASSGETTTAIEVMSVMKYGFRKPDGSLINSFSNLRREVYNGNLPFEYKVDSGKLQNLPFLSRIYTQSTRATTVETSLYYANSMSKTNINFTADTEYNKFWYAYSNDLDEDIYAVTMSDYVSEDISQEGGIGVGFVMEDINGDLYMGNSQDETKKISPNEKELTQAEYDALSDAEKMNGTTYYITDASSNQKEVYSTSEQAVGTWIDGKIIKNGVEYAGTPQESAYDAGTYSGGSSSFITSVAQKLYSSTQKEVGVIKQFSATWSGYGDGFGFYFWKSSTKLIGCWFPSEYGGGWSVLNFSNTNGSITKFGTLAAEI